MKHWKLLLLILACCTLPDLCSAQHIDSRTIEGFVGDSLTGESLIGVNIYLKSTKSGTVSDVSGKYSLLIPSEACILVFSYIGFNTKEIPIQPGIVPQLEVYLKPSEAQIDEVKITAQRKFFGNMDYGREIPSINSEVIEKQSLNNASDILHARLAGVWATKTSGAPGDHQKIRIRGQNSFSSSAEPLYVVDGVPVPIVNLSSLGIADLNIHDIANVTVLKDASSTALYGFQGGNGVVLIDTKQGGEKEISFSVKSGIQWFNNYYDFLSAKEQITILDTAYENMRFIMSHYYPEINDSLCNRDWQDFIFSPGDMQEYQLSVAGSKGKIDYYISGNYTDHTGIIKTSNYNRYTFSTRAGRKFGKRLAIDLAYRGSYQKNKDNQDEYMGNRVIWESITKSPSFECTDDSLLFSQNDGTVNLRALNYYVPLKKVELPQQVIDSNHHQLNIKTHALSGFVRFQLGEHLSMDMMESLMLRSTDYAAKFDYYYYYNYGGQLGFEMESSEDVILYNHQVNISYYNTWGNHDVSLVLAHRYYKDNLWWQIDTLEGTLDENFSLKNSMASYGPQGSVLRNMSSYIAHASYSFRKKYFLSAIANISQIKEGAYTDYYSFFPSLAFSWNLAEEVFLRNSSVIDDLSLYTNWGRSGNYPLNGLSNDLYTNAPYAYGGAPNYYPSVLQLANHRLKHENTSELDFGLKSSLLNHRLKISGSYFRKQISNLIIQRDIPLYYGGGRQFMNLARIDVNGYEISLEAIPVHNQQFSWLLSVNYSQSIQLVKKLDDGESILYKDPDILIPEFLIEEGQGLGDIYGFKYLGKWSAKDEADTSNSYVNLRNSKFLNADSSDYELTESDKVSLGNSMPDFTCNFFSSLQYKNWGLDMHWYAAIGQEKYNATYAAAVMAAVHPDVIDYVNDTLYVLGEDAFYESSVFVEDASFIRLKTLTIRYSPNKKILDKGRLDFSLSFENLITLTKYSGYDPEATIFTDNNFSDNSIDRGAYPNPKAVYLTLKLTF